MVFLSHCVPLVSRKQDELPSNFDSTRGNINRDREIKLNANARRLNQFCVGWNKAR